MSTGNMEFINGNTTFLIYIHNNSLGLHRVAKMLSVFILLKFLEDNLTSNQIDISQIKEIPQAKITQKKIICLANWNGNSTEASETILNLNATSPAYEFNANPFLCIQLLQLQAQKGEAS